MVVDDEEVICSCNGALTPSPEVTGAACHTPEAVASKLITVSPPGVIFHSRVDSQDKVLPLAGANDGIDTDDAGLVMYKVVVSPPEAAGNTNGVLSDAVNVAVWTVYPVGKLTVAVPTVASASTAVVKPAGRVTQELLP
jgi:hypothetical protein